MKVMLVTTVTMKMVKVVDSSDSHLQPMSSALRSGRLVTPCSWRIVGYVDQSGRLSR